MGRRPSIHDTRGLQHRRSSTRGGSSEGSGIDRDQQDDVLLHHLTGRDPASGHPVPTVMITPPATCTSPEEVKYNSWQLKHILSTGVQGIHYAQASSPEAVRAYVAATRYEFQKIGRDKGLPLGVRGNGGQGRAAQIWGISPDEYLVRADPWPLNPDGELLLGLKIEDQESLKKADDIVSTPGVAVAAVGVSDMSMSYGYSSKGWPYQEEVRSSLETVHSACERAGVHFVQGWHDPEMTDEETVKFLIEERRAMVMPTTSRNFAEAGRRLTGRTMPV